MEYAVLFFISVIGMYSTIYKRKSQQKRTALWGLFFQAVKASRRYFCASAAAISALAS